MVTTNSFARTSSKATRVKTGDEQTGEPTATGNPDSGGPLLKVEETLEEVVDVKPSGTERQGREGCL